MERDVLRGLPPEDRGTTEVEEAVMNWFEREVDVLGPTLA